MNSNIIWIVISLVLFIYGIKTVKDREFAIGFGRPQPLFVIRLTDGFALVIGIALMIIGIVNMLCLLLVSAKPDTSTGWTDIVGVEALIFAFIFVLGLVLQYAISLGKWLRKYRVTEEKAKR